MAFIGVVAVDVIAADLFTANFDADYDNNSTVNLAVVSAATVAVLLFLVIPALFDFNSCPTRE